MRFPFKALSVAAVLTTAAACTNIDCPLDNIVAMTSGLYSAETQAALTLTDTLTVKAGGVKDTILLNRAVGISDFQLPLRQGVAQDTLLFRFSNARGQYATDTLFVNHTNEPHFESMDCPTAMFHTLQGVSWTSHRLALMPLTIDSVALVRKTVNYEDIENLRIYLRSAVVQ